MKEDTLRTAILRSQTLKEILERDIQALVNLKPTNLIAEKEMTSLIQMAKDERPESKLGPSTRSGRFGPSRIHGC